MIKYLTICVVLTINISFLYAQKNDLLWTTQFTGVGQNQIYEMVTDNSGNVYAVGQFTSTVNQGAFNLTSVGSSDVYIIKYNKNGQVQWLKQIGGTTIENPLNIVFSNDQNFFYVVVNSNSNPVNFDGNSIVGTGLYDIYIAKFAIDGTYQWAKNVAYNPTTQFAPRLVVDNQGNLLLTGQFITNVTFYGGTTSLSDPSGLQQIFIAKFDGNCNLFWAKQLVGTSNNCLIRSVTCNSNNYYFSGAYFGSLTLDLGVLSNAGNRDMFLYKTDTAGNGVWVRKIIGTGEEYLFRNRSDASGNQFLVGYYNSPTLTADSTATLPSVKTFANAGSNDIFYACYAPDGTLQFAKSFGSAGDDQGLAVNVNNDHVIIGGQYTGAISFDGFSLTNSSTDAFMVETDKNGVVLNAKKASGTSTDVTKTCNIDATGCNLFAGDFMSPTLNISGTVLTNGLSGVRDMFVAKFGTITITSAVTNVLCSGEATGQIAITVTGDGTPPYTYLWSDASTNDTISNIIAGWYYVTVTDANGATKVDSAQVTESSALALIFNTTNTLCPSSTDGAIDLSVVGGVSPYTYLWGDGITTEDRSALPAGNYSVTVTDFNGCTKTGSTTVSNPSTMILTTSITPPSCVPGADGAIDLTVINGSAPYTYLWNDAGSSITQDISGLISGTYSVTVTDANLCSVTGSFDVINPAAPQVTYTKTDISCVPGNDGAIDVLVSGGTSPFTYLWNDGQSTQDRIGLVAGNYIMTVTDAASCSVTTAIINLSNPSTPSVSFIPTNPTCVPGNDGTIDLIAYSGNPPFNYIWSNLQITEDLSNLSDGTYTVTVSDTKGCSVVDSVTISRQFPVATITPSGATAFCQGQSVVLQATVAGGYIYQWQESGTDIAGAVSSAYTASASGNYTVIITNSDGCSDTSAVEVVTVNPLPTVYNVIGGGNYCSGSTGVSVGLSNSDLGVNYELYLNGVTTSNILAGTGLTLDFGLQTLTGSYTVVATDATTLCTENMSNSVVVAVSTSPISVITPSGATTFCQGQNVVLQATVAGGYIYQWQESGTDIAGAVSSAYTASASGNYTVIITNSDGCSDTSAVEAVIVNPLPTIYNVIGGGNYCSGSTGVSVGLSNSDLGVNYELYLNGVTTSNILAGTGLTLDFGLQTLTGSYTVVATDATTLCTENMSNSVVVAVSTSPISVITPSGATTFCQGQSVVLQATVAGGYIYQWQESGTDISGAVSSAYTASASGNYTVIITNSDGCSDTSAVEVVTVNPLPTVYNVIGGGNYCSGSTGVSVGLSNSDLGVNYELYLNGVTTSNILAGTGLTLDFGLQTLTGTYTVVSTDATTLCMANMNGSAVVDTVLPLTASLNAHTLVIFCVSNANGEATVTTQNGLAPITYTWSASTSTGPYANDLGIGINYVTVSDGCGTIIIDSIAITSLPSMSASITSSTPANCATSLDGSATVTAIGGIAPYSYVWSNSSSSTATASDLIAGTHYVTISDYCGSVVDSVNITTLPLLSISISSLSQVSCTGGNNGSALVVANYGVSPYTYLWSSTETSDTAYQLVDGWNYVTVTDGCGQLIDSIQISTALPMSIAITSNSPTSCAGGNNGAAQLSVTNGSAPFTFQWSTNNLFTDTINTNAFATTLINDTNWVRVTDACGSLIDSVIISSLPVVTATITYNVDASCSTTADGKATVTVSNGAAPYTYAWSNSASHGWVAMDLLPGMNYVTVTDQCGFAIDSVSIGVKTPLNASITSSTPTLCVTDSNGTATVTALDGGLPYTFVWSASSSTTNVATDLPVGNHFVTVSDVCGSVVVSVSITNTPTVTATISKQNTKCFGLTNGSINVTAVDGVSPYTYTWSDTTLTDSVRTNVASGTYYVTISDQCGSYSDSVTINTPGALSLSTITTNVSFTGLSDGAIDVIMSGGVQPYYYDWSNSATTEDLHLITEGTYILTVTDENGCTISDSIDIVTDSWHIEIYKAFTPNNDNKNDVWNIKHISAYPNCTVNIFDEWGIKVFESTGYATPWDGKNKNGKMLPSATYYYIIDLKDGSKVYTGSVALIK